jgi:hypothetical protein
VLNRREIVTALGAAIAGCKALRYRPDDPQPLDEHELATLAAIADTFLPGPPSGTEAGAVARMIEPAYGLLPYISELVSDLDQWCIVTKLVAFKGMSPAQREVALEQRMGLRGKAMTSWYLPAYEGALALTKLALCDHAHGAAFLAFPGASPGYEPATAAGVYASATPEIVIAGTGTVRALDVGILLDGAGPVSVFTSDGRAQTFDPAQAATSFSLGLTGATAAGRWELQGAVGLRHWWLRVRT